MGCLRSCFNKIFILIFLLVALAIYLFWKYPPWFQAAYESINKIF